MTQENLVPRGRTALVVMALSLLVYTALDLGSKEWALGALSRPREGKVAPVCQVDSEGFTHMQRTPTTPQVVIPGYFLFHYAENCGAAFGMLRTAPAWVRGLVFGLAGLSACVVLTLMFKRGVGGPLFAGAVPLILSGAVGNLADRLRHGFVVDFIQVDPQWFQYPTFNVADCAITIGVALMLIDGIRNPQTAPRAESDRPAA